MKALVYTGERQLEWTDVDDPAESSEEIEVRIEAAGICGSDMHAYFGHDERRPPPLILGHEASGEALSGAYRGKRVVFSPLVTCGTCEACRSGRSNLCSTREIISMAPRQGAFAERVVVPERNIVEVPDNLSAVKAALTEPVATAFHAIEVAERASWRPLAESKGLVLGGGAIGLSAALILRDRDCPDIVVADTNPLRRSAASDGQGFNVVDPVTSPLESNAFDFVIDAVGARVTRQTASHAVKPGGVITHIGLQDSNDGLDVRKITLQEIMFVGAYTYTLDDFRTTLSLLASGRLGDLSWLEERQLSDGAKAFQDLSDGKVSAAKVVLTTNS